MAVKDFIVAIELGSSKITGIAGRKDTDGSLQVLAIVQEPSSGFIKKGVIYNIEKTAACLTSIVNKLQNILQAKIGKVYVGISGQSVHSVLNVVNRNLDTETIVDEEIIDSIKEENILTPYSDMEIIDIIPQEYRVGNDRQVDPIGILTNVVEGNFLNILARTSVRSKIKQCFQKANIEIAEVVVSPIALADAVLTDQEKRSGCALVDFGADTTTVAVYNGNILRHLVVIPIGGHNVTKDICSLQIEESEAEQLKKKYGSAFTPLDKMDDTRTYPIHDDRIVEAKQLNKIVEARIDRKSVV